MVLDRKSEAELIDLINQPCFFSKSLLSPVEAARVASQSRGYLLWYSNDVYLYHEQWSITVLHDTPVLGILD